MFRLRRTADHKLELHIVVLPNLLNIRIDVFRCRFHGGRMEYTLRCYSRVQATVQNRHKHLELYILRDHHKEDHKLPRHIIHQTIHQDTHTDEFRCNYHGDILVYKRAQCNSLLTTYHRTYINRVLDNFH